MAAWEFQTLQNIADRNGWHKFITMQNYYNLIYREEEREMVSPSLHPLPTYIHTYILTSPSTQIPYCNDTGVALIPWSPIARGALTRPWTTRSSKRASSDKFLEHLVHSREDAIDKEIISRVEQVANKRGVSMACIATAWAIGKGVVPIIGLGSKERIEETVRNSKFELEEGDRKFLEEVYAPKERQGF